MTRKPRSNVRILIYIERGLLKSHYYKRGHQEKVDQSDYRKVSCQSYMIEINNMKQVVINRLQRAVVTF